MNILPAWYEDDERYLAYQLEQLPLDTDSFIAGVKVRKTNGNGKSPVFNTWHNGQRRQLHSAKDAARLICTCEMEQAS